MPPARHRARRPPSPDGCGASQASRCGGRLPLRQISSTRFVPSAMERVSRPRSGSRARAARAMSASRSTLSTGPIIRSLPLARTRQSAAWNRATPPRAWSPAPVATPTTSRQRREPAPPVLTARVMNRSSDGSTPPPIRPSSPIRITRCATSATTAIFSSTIKPEPSSTNHTSSRGRRRARLATMPMAPVRTHI